MKLLRPDTRPLNLLFLGGSDLPTRELRERFREAGLLLDLAMDRESAFATFLERGGHEVILRMGCPSPEVEEVLSSLRDINPAVLDWRFAALPSLEELEAFESEIRMLLEDREAGIPRP